MANFRSLCATVALASLTVVATASFDLVYVADTGTDTIHRFDGGSGVYLGAMAGPWVDPTALALDQSAGLMFVGGQNGLFIVDMWDGTVFAATAAPSARGAFSVGGGQFVFAPLGDSTHLGRMQIGVSGWSVGPSFGGAAIHRPTTALAGNDLYTAAGTTLSRHNWIGPIGTPSLAASVTTGIAYVGQSAARPGAASFAQGPGGNGLLQWSTGGVVSTSAWSAFSSLTGVAYTRGSMVYVAGRNAANTSGLLAYGGPHFGGTALRTYGVGILQQPSSVAVVVAPEPGVMAGLALGAAALLRRKKAKKK